MSLFFSGAVTSSPIKRRLRGNHSCQSPDVSLLSPDSSYVCFPSADAAAPCCCRRSPRLLTNGYYDVTEDSFWLDEDGNVSLTGCRTSVSYKENLVRVFRRRRKPRRSLVALLTDVTESCQSWLDQKVLGGILGTGPRRNQDPDWYQEPNWNQDPDWAQISQGDEFLLPGLNSTELEHSCSFTYDPFEAPPPPDKEAPPLPCPQKLLMQEEICSEVAQSKLGLSQSLAGLSEVPPPPAFSSCCCQNSPETPGLTMKALLVFGIFFLGALCWGSLFWGVATAAAMLAAISAGMFMTKSGPMGEWRRAKTEDITSRNE